MEVTIDMRVDRCPFCGSRAKVMRLDYDGTTVWGVFCEEDMEAEHAHGHYVDNYATEQEAIDAWKGVALTGEDA